MPRPRSDLAACRDLLRGGSRTFYAASFGLPRATRDAATALYGFCRLSDDAIDVAGDALPALDALHARLDRIYSGESCEAAADRAFAAVVDRYEIPKSLPEALLEGFEWDAHGRRYRDLAELRAYSVRVAGTVGMMMSLVMGARERSVLGRACALGAAMQLTNIARDVGEDARAGRLYLPLDWLSEEGIDAQRWMADPRFSGGLARVVRRLLMSAEQLYREAASGISALPRTCRPGIHAARLMYREIGRELERAGLDSVAQRTRVPATRKAALLCSAVALSWRSSRARTAAPMPEALFLLDDVSRSVAVRRGQIHASEVGRIEWLIDLFERLERRESNVRASS